MFSHGDQQPPSLCRPGLMPGFPLGVVISKYLCEMRKHKVLFTFLESCVACRDLSWEGPQPLLRDHPGNRRYLENREQGSVEQYSFPGMGQNGLPQGLYFLERQGLSGGDYSSAGCGRRLGTHGKHKEPPLTLTEAAQERTPTLIHDCQLEKHRQILQSCV